MNQRGGVMKNILMLIIVLLLLASCTSGKTDIEDNPSSNDVISSDDNTSNDNTDIDNQNQNDSSNEITVEMEEFKKAVDDVMQANFDDYNSYYDDAGTLNLDITVEGISSIVDEAKNGNQAYIDSWNEMVEALIASNTSLIESAKLHNIKNPSISFNILNDENKDQILLCINNGEAKYDALNE